MNEKTVYHMRELIDQLNSYTKAYDEGHPIISDEEWDKLYFELKALEGELNIIFPDSPTQTIAYEVVNELQKVEHNHLMLSLDKTKDKNEILNFVKDNSEYLYMLKMDGLTCSLVYQNGELISAETRGNGIVGENILHNAKVISSIPQHISYKETLIIDGEIICKINDFETFASDYKNPRNFAAGSIRLQDAEECAKRKLTFVVWDIIKGFNQYDYLSNKLLDAERLGFTIVPFLYNDTEHSFEQNEEYLRNLAIQRNYPIDGLVIKFDSITYSKSLGQTSHHFKNAIAYKFYDETYETTLTDIEWSMGRTGVLTPIAIFEPVEIDGSIISRASLHNINVMQQLWPDTWYTGLTLTVYKANMIIPQISKVESKHRDAISYLLVPKVCPYCGKPTEVREEIGTINVYCTNSSCEGKLINKLDHFCGKTGLDIKGLSKATLEKLIAWGWVTNIIDLFGLAKYRNEWIKQPGFGDKSVDNILNAIETARYTTMHQFIASLGIPLIGATAAKALENHFSSWQNFIDTVHSNYNFDDLASFGMEMDAAIKNFNYSQAEYLVNHQIITFSDNAVVNSNKTNNILQDLTFVITGKLNNFKNRDELKSLIESYGGKVVGSISKNTSYLINNDVHSTSTKNKKAQSLGISIISEDDFIKLYSNQ